MMTWLAFLNTAAEVWRAYMIPAAWQSALVGALLLGVVYSIRRAPAPLRYGLLLLALVKFAIPPLLPVSYAANTPVSEGLLSEAAVSVATLPENAGIAPARELWTPVPAQIMEENSRELRPLASPALTVPAASISQPAAAVPPFALRTLLREHGWTLLLLFHALGALFVLLYLGIALMRTGRFANVCDPVKDPAVLRLFQELQARLGIRRRIRLLTTEAPCGPMAMGALHPIVIMPSTLLESLSSAQLEAVLAHELAHHRRGDLWLLQLENALLALWWFHPVLWLVRHTLRGVREDCCDDLLIASGISGGETYCTTLLEAAGHTQAPRWAHAALGVAEKFHPLGRRLRRIMDVSIRRTPRLSTASLALLLVLAVILVPGVRLVEGKAVAASGMAATTPREPESGDAVLSEAEKEIQAHYTKADPEVQEYIRWTVRTFTRGGLWQPANAYETLSAEDREKKILYLVEVLNSEYGRHLCQALAESGALQDKRLLPGLIKAAAYHRDDSDYDCRPKWMAVSALGRQDDESAVPVLIPLVDHGNQNTRIWARASLARLTGQYFGEDKQAWGKWWNEAGKQPPIDLTQLKPWVSPVPEQAAPIEKKEAGPKPDFDPKMLEGKPIFKGEYVHQSRGGKYGQTMPLTVLETENGAITAVADMSGLTSTSKSITVVRGDKTHRLITSESYDENFVHLITFEDGKAIMKRWGIPDRSGAITLEVPPGTVYDPNSRPDSYCAANILLRHYDVQPGDTKELKACDIDNSGDGLVAYTIRIEHKGKEDVTVPAGTFEANHLVLTQTSSADTWFKKREGHITDFWVLDNGVIVRILRHREPYEMLLAKWEVPEDLPGLKERGTFNPPGDTTSYTNRLPEDQPRQKEDEIPAVYTEPWSVEAEHFAGIIQGENIVVEPADALPGQWSGGNVLMLRPDGPATYTITAPVPANLAKTYTLVVFCSAAPGNGLWEIWLNGERVSQNDLYRPESPARVSIEAPVKLIPGINNIELKVIDKNPASTGYAIAIDCIGLRG